MWNFASIVPRLVRVGEVLHLDAAEAEVAAQVVHGDACR